MKRLLPVLFFLCGLAPLNGAPAIPEQLASEVREYFRREPQLFQGNPRLFDDVLLTVGRAVYNPEKREESRILAQADARAGLEKFLRGFQAETRTVSGETMSELNGSLRISKYSKEEIRTKMCGKQKNVEFFGEWLSDNGAMINIAAGIVYGRLAEPAEKVKLKNFHCTEPWDHAVQVSRGLHVGGVLLTADDKENLFLLVSAGAKKNIPPAARDTLIRGRALARASAYVMGKEIEEKTFSVEVIRRDSLPDKETIDVTFDFKRLQREKTECIARLSKIGSWESHDGKEEFQVFLLKLSEIWE